MVFTPKIINGLRGMRLKCELEESFWSLDAFLTDFGLTCAAPTGDCSGQLHSDDAVGPEGGPGVQRMENKKSSISVHRRWQSS